VPSPLFRRLFGIGVGTRVAIIVEVAVLIQSCIFAEVRERDRRDDENTHGTAARVMHRSVARMWLWIRHTMQPGDPYRRRVGKSRIERNMNTGLLAAGQLPADGRRPIVLAGTETVKDRIEFHIRLRDAGALRYLTRLATLTQLVRKWARGRIWEPHHLPSRAGTLPSGAKK
jgi:hypothetical protein